MSIDFPFSEIFPQADPKDIADLGPGLLATMTRYEINTPLRQAHFLAQVGHESGQLRYREEIASGDAYDTRTDLGNTPERDGDGRKYKGRGLIQLTGKANYAEYDNSLALRGLLLREPERVAINVDLCCGVAGWYWAKHNLNKHADKDDILKITRKINGGYNGLKDRSRLLALAKKALLNRRLSPTPEQTKRIQAFLNSWGYLPALVADGQLGPKTRSALSAYFSGGWSLPEEIIEGRIAAELRAACLPTVKG